METNSSHTIINQQHIVIISQKNKPKTITTKIKNVMKKLKSMNLSFLRITITITVLIAFVCNGCKKIETEIRSYSFIVSRNNSALSNSSVSIPTNNQNYSATTDNDGKCQINIPNGVTLPKYVIVSVDHNSIKPYALSVSGSSYTKTSRSINCQNVPLNVKIKDAALHHLGNDNYSGSANSQLQLSAEGLQKTFNFYLSSIPSSMPYLQIFARGVEHPTEIILNGITTNYLGNSDPNGDLTHYDYRLNKDPNKVLKIGNNVLTIKTGANNGADPWDDIEICGLLLYY